MNILYIIRRFGCITTLSVRANKNMPRAMPKRVTRTFLAERVKRFGMGQASFRSAHNVNGWLY